MHYRPVMHYMASPLSFRWDEAFIARIDARRGKMSRSAFVRAAVEAALTDDTQAASSAERSSGRATTTKASATGPSSARSASRPAASPRPNAAPRRINPAVAARQAKLNKAKGL
jgi:hypothetical protein